MYLGGGPLSYSSLALVWLITVSLLSSLFKETVYQLVVLAFPTVRSTQWCSTLLHISFGVYFTGSLSIYWCMSSIDSCIDFPCNPLPICLFQQAFKWSVRLNYYMDSWRCVPLMLVIHLELLCVCVSVCVVMRDGHRCCLKYRNRLPSGIKCTQM